MIRIALALGGLQLLCILTSWVVSPVRPLAWLACLLWLGGMMVLVRHRSWVGGIRSGWRRVACVALWQLPGLGSGACSLAIFSGIWHAPSIAVFILQGWLQPLAPVLVLVPRVAIDQVACYLWVAALVPVVLFAITAGLAARVSAPRGPLSTPPPASVQP